MGWPDGSTTTEGGEDGWLYLQGSPPRADADGTGELVPGIELWDLGGPMDGMEIHWSYERRNYWRGQIRVVRSGQFDATADLPQSASIRSSAPAKWRCETAADTYTVLYT